MEITNIDISNFRALKSVSIPIQKFSVLLGENDVGKTSFLYALEKFFVGKKLNDPKDWYKKNTEETIRLIITFNEFGGDDTLEPIKRTDGSIVISKTFKFDTTPEVRAILDDQSPVAVPRPALQKWFSQDNYHFIPVRRDLAVQFSMNKTALLGKLLRAKMKLAIEEAGAQEQMGKVVDILKNALSEPRKNIEIFLREQLNNDAVKLGFDELEIDPAEGVKFSVTLSDDRVESIQIQDRGAGTQNNLIIALFRLIAEANIAGNFIFAMEEPENSLHPKAQRQLLSVIQQISEITQVIVTTHSPVFIDRSKFESNILLNRTLKGNTIAKVFDENQLSEVRTDLGIRASDALLKGGGNCAVLVEGNTEEEGFPIFMEMLGLSEFELGIAIINMGGSDFQKARNIVTLLKSYDIPCIVVLDRDANTTKKDLLRMKGNGSIPNLEEVYCLEEGTIEDYYPVEVVADVINNFLNPEFPVSKDELNQAWSGRERLEGYKKIMREHGSGDSLEYLKSALGGTGTRIMKENGFSVHNEIEAILKKVEEIASNQ